MRRLLEEFKKEVEDFIEQRDDFLLLSTCSSNDMPVALKILRDIEQGTATDVFLLFADKFVEPSPFVSVAVERLREEYNIASEYLKEEGREPLAPIPDIIFDESHPPENRLREAISFARSLVPKEGGHRLVWTMFPEEIINLPAYLRLVASVVPWNGIIKPWMRGIRLIFRNEKDYKQYLPQLKEVPRVRMNKFNFNPDAITDSLKKDVEDEDLPQEQRMQSLYSFAIIDYANNRTEDAIKEFEYLLGYYQRTQNNMMQAMVMNGLGDVFYHRVDDINKAQYWYECAVPPAIESKTPIVMATIVKNLGDLSYKSKKYGDAEQYFDNLDKLKAQILDPEGKAQALEWRGLSQEKQGAYDRAIESWEAAALLCRNIGMPYFLQANLKHLQRVYKRFHIKNKLAAVEDELKKLEQQEVANGYTS